MQPSPFLWPLAYLFGIGVKFRNYLYNRGLRKSFGFDLPTIGVGNLTVGGTGKTPHIAFLLEYLSQQYQVAVLSRGYGRKTKGFRLAEAGCSAATIGDEPMLLFERYATQCSIAVCEDRVAAIPILLDFNPETQVILLDDNFQHRALRVGLQLLLCEYGRPFYDDQLLPAGYLREPPESARRADVVVVSKCPENLSRQVRSEMVERIRQAAGKALPVFFSAYCYGTPQAVAHAGTLTTGASVFLLSGIANPEPLHNYVSKQFSLMGELSLPDHAEYHAKNLGILQKKLSQLPESCALLTTAKDMVKLKQLVEEGFFGKRTVFFLPITVDFLDDRAAFLQTVNGYLAKYDTPEA